MVEIVALTDVGAVRKHNEDAYLVNRVISDIGHYHIPRYEGNLIAAVADGVGGEEAGEIASAIALEEMKSLALPVDEQTARQKILTANERIIHYGETHPEAAGLCTTLTGIVTDGNRVLCFNVGNSRVYRFRKGFLQQITTDQTLVRMMVESGKMSQAEAAASAEKNMLLQYLGGRSRERKLEVELQWIGGTFDPGDIYLLSSDGLHDLVDIDALEERLGSLERLESAVESLTEYAIRRGGHDNITVVAIRKL